MVQRVIFMLNAREREGERERKRRIERKAEIQRDKTESDSYSRMLTQNLRRIG